MLQLKTSITTRLPKSLEKSNLHKDVKESLDFNLSVLPDAVFSGSSELRNPSRLSLASVAYCKSLIYTLDIQIERGIEDGFFYDADDHVLYCDTKYKKVGIDYPGGIRLPLELIKMITPCTLLRNDEVSDFANYSKLASDNYFIGQALKNKDFDGLITTFKDFARAYIDPTLKESTEYMLFLAKWFGDSKPSYIEEDFARQISDILEIQGEIIEGMYETKGAVSAGVRQKTTEYLESIYRDDDTENVLLTKQFAEYLKSQTIRRNDAISTFDLPKDIYLQTTTVSLFDLDSEWDFESAYTLIKQAIEESMFLSTKVKKTDVGLFAEKTRKGTRFLLGDGQYLSEINAQVAWWCLVLS